MAMKPISQRRVSEIDLTILKLTFALSFEADIDFERRQ